MRMQSEEWRGVRIINDAYNANPASMKAALQTLAELTLPRPKNRGARRYVRAWQTERRGNIAGSARTQRAAPSIFSTFSATEPRWCATGALAAGMSPERVIIGKDHTELAKRLREQVKKGDCLLFKGSRGMKMEKVLDGLKSGKA